mmetsp:Transcript_2744/g.7256  ORF Transcript_2744/g.7256 Transcript_2744/m.7256 type:complete len:227 (+) Transcript_2744:64-744(+)
MMWRVLGHPCGLWSQSAVIACPAVRAATAIDTPWPRGSCHSYVNTASAYQGGREGGGYAEVYSSSLRAFCCCCCSCCSGDGSSGSTSSTDGSPSPGSLMVRSMLSMLDTIWFGISSTAPEDACAIELIIASFSMMSRWSDACGPPRRSNLSVCATVCGNSTVVTLMPAGLSRLLWRHLRHIRPVLTSGTVASPLHMLMPDVIHFVSSSTSVSSEMSVPKSSSLESL